jgi:trans-aconitate methyltransferase
VNSNANVRYCYDKTASAYAGNYFGELEKKNLDRILLEAFAKKNKEYGKMIDLGCGPGDTTNFLSKNGVKDILGIDLSAAMVEEARKLSPDLEFQMADMLRLPYNDKSFGSALAFYSIVHFSERNCL